MSTRTSSPPSAVLCVAPAFDRSECGRDADVVARFDMPGGPLTLALCDEHYGQAVDAYVQREPAGPVVLAVA